MDKIWLKSYPQGVPSTINPNAYVSILDLLQDSFRDYADQPAFENLGTQLTYRELLDKSQHLAAYLQHDLQLAKGDRLAVMLPNVLQYPIVLLACLQLGVIIVNINPLYTERELLLPLQDSEAKAIIVLANFTQSLAKVISETQIKHVIVTELGDEFSNLKRIVVNGYLKYIKKIIPPKLTNSISYKDALRLGRKRAVVQAKIKSEDIAFLQYTGGTTGKPKGAMLSHHNLIANILQGVVWIDNILEKGRETVVTALPLYHIFSLTICCFAFLKLGANSLLITNPRDISAFIKQLIKRPFSVFVGVNTLYSALLHHPESKKIDFSKLKLALAGGAPVMKNVADQWQAVTHKTIIVGYGLTEASPIVTINPLTSKAFTGSIGLPVSATEIKILDAEENEVDINTPGELCIRGPQVMKGYWHQSEETKQVLTDEGWLRTGDIVIMDEKGYLYLIDRKKDMILVSGFNVYPNEIEEVIASHPGVAEVAVIGIPDNQVGEMVKAFVVKKDLALTEEDIRIHCKQNLTGYKQPRVIEFCTDLPKSNVGKILKRELRNE